MNVKNERPAQSKNEQTLRLSKDSTSESLKTYFTKVFELKQSGKKFPVNLDVVWPVVYARKEVAVRVLKKDFVENIDFQALRRNVERGAASPVDYKLTVECMEYFIAKKVKPVFEVYRQVFHRVVESTTKQLNERTRLRPELAIPDDLPNLPFNHVFTADYITVCDYPIRRVTISGQFYYCLVDVQVAAGMDTRHRGQLNREIRKTYSFKS